MLMKMPYYMTNKDWYKEIKIDNHTVKDELTELGKSIPEVVKSFEEYNNYEEEPDSYVLDVLKETENEIVKSMREDYLKQGLSEEEAEKKIQEWQNGTAED